MRHTRRSVAGRQEAFVGFERSMSCRCLTSMARTSGRARHLRQGISPARLRAEAAEAGYKREAFELFVRCSIRAR